MDAASSNQDGLVPSEAAKHRRVVASAAVIGAALGFGAQQVVGDLLAGSFIIVERQYGYGDLMHISAVGFERATARSRRSPCAPPACAS
jgi:hypothetical protein